MKIADNIASRIVAWVGVMEDLSGLEINNMDWIDADNISETFRNIFCEIGNTYVPVLLANYNAVYDNQDKVETDINGKLWSQKPFPYQAKCLNWIKEQYNLLEGKDKSFINNFLAGSGCESVFFDKKIIRK